MRRMLAALGRPSGALCSAVLLFCTVVLCAHGVHHAIRGESLVAQREASLKDQLEKGLRARRPEEFAFIGRVVALVDDGKLPVKLVRGTFGWARRKKPYPFPYFERALKLRAAKIGVVVK